MYIVFSDAEQFSIMRALLSHEEAPEGHFTVVKADSIPEARELNCGDAG